MIYFYQFSYIVCYFFRPKARLTQFFFERLLLSVSTINGRCKSSGQCCHSIDIYNEGLPITNLSDWRFFLQQFPLYQSFKPTVFNGKIQAFNCSNLDANNRCLDYDNRPRMCRDYPKSFFLTHGRIHDGCGYYITVNSINFNRLFQSVQLRMRYFLDTSLLF